MKLLSQIQTNAMIEPNNIRKQPMYVSPQYGAMDPLNLYMCQLYILATNNDDKLTSVTSIYILIF